MHLSEQGKKNNGMMIMVVVCVCLFVRVLTMHALCMLTCVCVCVCVCGCAHTQMHKMRRVCLSVCVVYFVMITELMFMQQDT